VKPASLLMRVLRRSAIAASLLASLAPGAAATPVVQTNLVSNIPGLAAHLDPNLRNPWGIAESSGSPFWVADNGTGLSTLYNSLGAPLPLIVTIPPPGAGVPTGVVFNGTASFGGAHFIFATEDGTIAAWSGGTNAIVAAFGPGGSSYKGIADGQVGGVDFLYATNFTLGRIDAFDPSFALASLPGDFTDPNLPSGYAPFGIRNINGSLYVTYAVQNGEDDLPGPGHGIIDVFNPDGTLIRRLTSHGALDSPWGLALAPSGFAGFGGDLLVGNFGDGRINAYDPVTGAFIGTLADGHGNPIVNDGLWGLQFGNGGNGGSPNALYLTAGLNDEADGLFAVLRAPEPTTLALIGVAVAGLAIILWRKPR
jgi:uncharacterized protein (TIGR03118 family)